MSNFHSALETLDGSAARRNEPHLIQRRSRLQDVFGELRLVRDVVTVSIETMHAQVSDFDPEVGRVLFQCGAERLYGQLESLSGTAVMAIHQVSARLARRAQLPESVGKAWTEEEERRLRAAFNRSKPIPEIATEHGRAIRAIEARLEKLGHLTPAPGTASPPYKTTSDPKEKK